jgi:hypothetical protein
MKTKIYATALITISLFLFSAQALRRGPEAAVIPQTGTAKTPGDSNEFTETKLNAYLMRWPARTLPEAAARARALAEMLVGRSLPSAPVEMALKSAKSDSAGWTRPFSDVPDIIIRYTPQADDTRVLNLELTSDPFGMDIGEDLAREAMQTYFRRLAERGLIDPSHYDLKKVRAGHTRSASGSKLGSERLEWVEEYRFTLLRQLNGIDVANAGITIGVHPTGQLSSVRLGGVEVESVGEGDSESPTAQGGTREVLVSKSEIANRFNAEVPFNAHAQVSNERLMYVMPEEAREAVVEPMYVYTYSLEVDLGGATSISRKKTVGYSLTAPFKPPTDFLPPGAPEPHVAQPPKSDRTK